jgi:hypothetical protein
MLYKPADDDSGLLLNSVAPAVRRLADPNCAKLDNFAAAVKYSD